MTTNNLATLLVATLEKRLEGLEVLERLLVELFYLALVLELGAHEDVVDVYEVILGGLGGTSLILGNGGKTKHGLTKVVRVTSQLGLHLHPLLRRSILGDILGTLTVVQKI
jgi:hypothetical protein